MVYRKELHIPRHSRLSQYLYLLRRSVRSNKELPFLPRINCAPDLVIHSIVHVQVRLI